MINFLNNWRSMVLCGRHKNCVALFLFVVIFIAGSVCISCGESRESKSKKINEAGQEEVRKHKNAGPRDKNDLY